MVLPIESKISSFEKLLSIVPEDASVVLIDGDGYKYEPIGYYIDDIKRMQLTLTPSSPIRTIRELSIHKLSGSSDKRMILIFQVTEGQVIKEFRVGDITIGLCEVEAKSGRR